MAPRSPSAETPSSACTAGLGVGWSSWPLGLRTGTHGTEGEAPGERARGPEPRRSEAARRAPDPRPREPESAPANQRAAPARASAALAPTRRQGAMSGLRAAGAAGEVTPRAPECSVVQGARMLCGPGEPLGRMGLRWEGRQAGWRRAGRKPGGGVGGCVRGA